MLSTRSLQGTNDSGVLPIRNAGISFFAVTRTDRFISQGQVIRVHGAMYYRAIEH